MVRPVLVTMFLLLCACTATGHPPDDQSIGTIEMYGLGELKAECYCRLHAAPEVGQFWEQRMRYQDVLFTDRWQVVRVSGQTALLENQQRCCSRYVDSNYVLAYEVTLEAAPGKPNVLRAWIGRPGAAPTEVQVASNPPDPESANCTITEQPFEGLGLAGVIWSGTLTIRRGDGWSTRTWTASGGWFGGGVATDFGHVWESLASFGTDATPLLKW